MELYGKCIGTVIMGKKWVFVIQTFLVRTWYLYSLILAIEMEKTNYA